MSNLIPEVRVNKNGVPVVKHVKPHDAGKPPVASIPVPTAVYQPLPALKGKVLKEAKEILRLAGNGDQEYEDRVTAAYLGNDIRSMRILSSLTNNAENYNDDMFNIIDTRTRVGLGNDEDPEVYVAKCRKYLEMISGRGPLRSDDFLPPHVMGEEGGLLAKWLEENWDEVDDIMDFFEGRHMEEYSAREHEQVWNDYKEFPSKPLFDGFI